MTDMTDMTLINPISKSKKTNTDKKIVPLSDYKKGYKDSYASEASKESQTGSSAPGGITVKALPKSPTTQRTSQHIRISVRLPRGIVTSLTIKKNIIALWLLYRTPSLEDPEQILDLLESGGDVKDDTVGTMVNNFVYHCLSFWEQDTGKGLSDFVTERMIEDALEVEDYDMYVTLLGLIK